MNHPTGLRRYLSYLHPYAWQCVVIVLGVIIEMGFYAAVPFSFRYLVDEALIKHDSVALTWVLSLLGIGAVLVTLMGLWRDKLYALVQSEYIARIRYEMFHTLQQLSLDFYARNKKIQIMLRYKRDLGSMESYASGLVPKMVLPFLQMLSAGVLMYVVDWRLGIAGTVLWPLIYVGPKRFSPKVMEEYTNRKIQEGQAEDVIKESISAQNAVQAYGLQNTYLERYAQWNAKLTGSNKAWSYYTALVKRSVGIGSLLSLMAVMGIGSFMVWHELLSIGSLLAFQGLFVAMSHALADFMQNLPSFLQARDGLANVEALLNEMPLVKEPAVPRDCPPLARAVSFRHVTFGYEPDKPLVKGVTFDVARGTSVAIVGTTGSGKSTLVSLLERFYDPASGEVLFDGVDIREFGMQSLRARTALVFEHPILFESSVRDNIRAGKLDATDEEVIAAAQTVDVHAAIMALPKGYDTVVKDNTRLNFNHRQRIALARAIIRTPDVLVLDEATSILDQHAEIEFAETIKNLCCTRTVVEVSNRLCTTMHMNTIIMMDKGKIVERGTHQQLLDLQGKYYALWQKQSGFEFSADGDEVSITPERLRAFPIFSSLSDDLLNEIAAEMASETHPADRTVVQEGDPGDLFFIIVRGRVDVFKQINEQDVHVASLEDGDYFGEVSLLRNEPRTATIRTSSPTTFLVLHRQQFNRLLEADPGLHATLEATFQQRLEGERAKREQTAASAT